MRKRTGNGGSAARRDGGGWLRRPTFPCSKRWPPGKPWPRGCSHDSTDRLGRNRRTHRCLRSQSRRPTNPKAPVPGPAARRLGGRGPGGHGWVGRSRRPDEDLALHLEDLSEETKQVQLLWPASSASWIKPAGRCPGVTPWEPPDLSPAGRGASARSRRPQPVPAGRVRTPNPRRRAGAHASGGIVTG